MKHLTTKPGTTLRVDVDQAKAPMEAAGRLLSDVAHEFFEDLEQPAFRAGFCASLVTAAFLARTRLPALAAVVVATMVGTTVEHLYGMAEDIHDKVTGEGNPYRLRVHRGNPNCMGHEAGAFPLDCPDGRRSAAGEV